MVEQVLETAWRGWGSEEIQAHLPSWHLLNERGRRNRFPLLVLHSYFASSGSCHICGCICPSDVWFCALAVPCFGSMGVPASGCHQFLQMFPVQLLPYAVAVSIVQHLAALWVQIPLGTESAEVFILGDEFRREVGPTAYWWSVAIGLPFLPVSEVFLMSLY